jgi:hypothetical protein
MSGNRNKPNNYSTPSKKYGGNNQSSGGNKQLSSSTPAASKNSSSSYGKLSSDEVQVPTLQFSGSERVSSNFYQFSEALHSACSISYGNIARIIKLNDWPIVRLPPKPVKPERILTRTAKASKDDETYDDEESEIDEEYELLVEDWKEARKLAIRENAKMRSFSSQMFSRILIHLSEESKAAVKEADD